MCFRTQPNAGHKETTLCVFVVVETKEAVISTMKGVGKIMKGLALLRLKVISVAYYLSVIVENVSEKRLAK